MNDDLACLLCCEVVAHSFVQAKESALSGRDERVTVKKAPIAAARSGRN